MDEKMSKREKKKARRNNHFVGRWVFASALAAASIAYTHATVRVPEPVVGDTIEVIHTTLDTTIILGSEYGVALRDAARLSTVCWDCTGSGRQFMDDERFWIIPDGYLSLYVSIPVRIRAGVDLSAEGLEYAGDLTARGGLVVSVALPAPEIISCELDYMGIDHDIFETHWEGSAEGTASLIFELEGTIKAEAQADAVRDGILDEARESAVSHVERIMMALGAEQVEVSFTTDPVSEAVGLSEPEEGGA